MLPGDVTANVVDAGSPQQAALGRPSPVPAHTVVPASGSSASPSRAFSKVNQSNATFAPVGAPESSTGGGQAAMLPSGNKSKSKLKLIVYVTANVPNGDVATPVPNTTQTNGGAVETKSATSAVIFEAVHSHSKALGRYMPRTATSL